MVKVTQPIPLNDHGRPDVERWVNQLVGVYPKLDSELIRRACQLLETEDVLIALELGSLIAELNLDDVCVVTGLIYREVRTGRVALASLRDIFDDDVCDLVESVHALAATSLLEMSNSKLQDHQQESQVENIKRMMIAMVDDPRVAVLKLAERVVALRRAKAFNDTRRRRIAGEARAVFAPLAARLGIGQLKWELEDLAFRYTDETLYMDIAQRLSGKRADREQQVNFLEDKIRGILRSQGIEAEVVGRAKHIFSIWRKMQSKSVSFDQVYDVSAVRVIVPRLADCYASLGIIHNTWPHIPSEFDDYIANPKENGYQSIHTALTLDDGNTLEVQIRTEEMHAEAELGVCAHWNYKGDAADQAPFAEKMEWLRQVMEWHEELGGTENLSTLLRHRASDDRIYVSTPQGHVLDLPRWSTVLDFAYRVHTDLGHTCRGGLINGQTATLDRQLENSEQVEILTDKAAQGPEREWLEKELGFVRTDRARAKLVTYFRNLPAANKADIGERLLAHAYAALDLVPFGDSQIAELEASRNLAEGTFFEALGAGEISIFDVVEPFIEIGVRGPQPELLGIEGTRQTTRRFSIRAANRDGLLHDITQILQSLSLNLTATSGVVDNGAEEAVISIETHISDWRQCLNLACHLRLIRGVIEVAG
ncbi:MAG: HD domain-containing protein [Pseudomonadales bacterium]|nr:HD domain-containing protein [Pseudomonadales bacterium]